MASVTASFDFLKWVSVYELQKPYEVFIPVSSFGDKKETVPRSNLVFETHQVQVEDVRGRQVQYSLDTHGFQFAKHMTAVQDLKNPDEVAEKYVPEIRSYMEDVVCAGEGARTFCFDIRVIILSLNLCEYLTPQLNSCR